MSAGVLMSAAPPSVRRVLVVDDNPAIHADVNKILRPSRAPESYQRAKALVLGGPASPEPSPRPVFDVESAHQGQDGLALANQACGQDQPFMVAFVDMRMPPGWDGLTTIRRLWEADPRLQVVVCTAYSDQSLNEVGGQLGPSDKLVILKKPFDTAEVLQLAATLSEKWIAERAAEVRVDQLERAVEERTAEIQHALLHDRLTGLPNRLLMHGRLEACIARRQRDPNQRFALLYLDFDRFKIINDSLGHEVGDDLLVAIADRLRNCLRRSDGLCRTGTASRIGGDEFLILLDSLVRDSDAALVAQRLLSILGEPYVVGEHTLHVTTSIGIAASAQDYREPGDMIRDADTAMYRAKAAGQGRYEMFDAQMHRQVTARMALEQGLRQAIRDCTPDLHYQPIVRLADGQVCAFEALLRWSHPQQGPVPAAELVSLAEDTGLIQPLSLLLLRKACAQLRDWQTRYGAARPLSMSVNLSRRQLIDPDLVSKIAEIVQASGIQPGSLALEITESTALSDGEHACEIFRALRELGIWLHLDDFGTGYSSLSCLYRIPLSGLKIDRSFIQNVCARPAHRVVLESIVRIARAFDLQIIAEGIETTEQFAMVRELGIDHAQGYLFGRPMPAASVPALLGEDTGTHAMFAAAFG